jgi:hypothetical protein
MWRSGELLCARGFQSAVGCVNAERGNTIWSRNVGGTRGIGGDAQYVFGADGSDRLTAWKIGNGDTFWTAEQFQNRKLSVPVSIGTTVLVGDFEGAVHLGPARRWPACPPMARRSRPRRWCWAAPCWWPRAMAVFTRSGQNRLT